MDQLPIDQFEAAARHWAAWHRLPHEVRQDIVADAYIEYVEDTSLHSDQYGISKAVRRVCRRLQRRSTKEIIGDFEFEWQAPALAEDSPIKEFVLSSVDRLTPKERLLFDLLAADPECDTEPLCKRLQLRPASLYQLSHKLRSKFNTLRLHSIFHTAMGVSDGDDEAPSGLDLCLDGNERSDVSLFLAKMLVDAGRYSVTKNPKDDFPHQALSRADFYLRQYTLARKPEKRQWMYMSDQFLNATIALLSISVPHEQFVTTKESLLALKEKHLTDIGSSAADIRRAKEWSRSWNSLAEQFNDFANTLGS